MIFIMISYAVTMLWRKHSPERAFALRKTWLTYFGHPILNIHVEVSGGPIQEPALYVSNHRSFADPVILCRYLDAYVIAKAEVASYPVINKGAELTGVLYVKRDDSKSRNEVRDLMVQTIKKGYNVLVYPEGTVGIQSKTLPFKVGSFMEAARNGIPVVPIAIEYRSEKDLWLIPQI
ncbi:MAG: 1-acyl-sn-glycerol-3-phosphate acyltransferase [Saprospiraceae bacterium]|nr:1-acyl-sn-glycerol-3-phosphate acyltransferase [Saprospiraceae bacterium]